MSYKGFYRNVGSSSSSHGEGSIRLNFDTLDTLVLLGSRITDSIPEGPIERPVARIDPFVHTLMRYRAAQLLRGWCVAWRVLIMGGHALGVRYDANPHVPPYKHPDFSFENVGKTQSRISEARLAGGACGRRLAVASNHNRRNCAYTTKEAMAILHVLYSRHAQGARNQGIFLGNSPHPRIGVLTNYYAHKKRAMLSQPQD